MTVQNVRRYKTELFDENNNTTIIFANLCASIISSLSTARPEQYYDIIMIIIIRQPTATADYARAFASIYIYYYKGRAGVLFVLRIIATLYYIDSPRPRPLYIIFPFQPFEVIDFNCCRCEKIKRNVLYMCNVYIVYNI